MSVLCVSCFLPAITAQTEHFHVQTKVVQVPVTVTDKNGRGIDGLKPSDFILLDDGVRQPVTVDDFSTGLPRISLALVIQTSGISTPALVSVRHIGSMIQPLVIGSRGEAAVVTFDNRVTWVQDFTSDDDKIQSAIKHLKPGAQDEARLLDAVAEVAAHMRNREGRKVLLLISESRDRGSETKFPPVLEDLTREGIQVFGAHYSAYATSMLAKSSDQPELPSAPEISDDPTDPPNPPPTVNILAIGLEAARLGKKKVVSALAAATGGADFPFVKQRGIENAIEKLGDELHSQYVLSFPQRQQAAGVHQITVSVPGHGDLVIRARRTYWATGDTP